ncbi:MAG: DUF2752 domain-containing protein [Ruminococcus sp.]|nr:DUF2752 domain-containing protein [Ruminococcus sp.]
MKKDTNRLAIVLAPIVIIPFLYLLLNFLGKFSVPCPIRLFTGIYCIGCGGTRCIKAIFHGHFLLAIRQNFIVFSGMIILALMWIQNIFSLYGRKIKLIPESRIFYTAVSGILIIYAVLRNFIPEIALV